MSNGAELLAVNGRPGPMGHGMSQLACELDGFHFFTPIARWWPVAAKGTRPRAGGRPDLISTSATGSWIESD